MTSEPDSPASFDYDVVIVGGGPAGCSAGVFVARYGLETAIFDRGRSSIRRCAHLENYLGFPAGIDVETLYGLMHDHAETAGCERVPDLVETVTRTGGEGSSERSGFVVETEQGKRITTRRLIAATRYGGEYLRGLDEEDAMFESYEHDGEEREQFDREYAETDGTTPIEGLYVASPSAESDTQAIVAAGRGARVGIGVVEDARRAQGYPDSVANYYDWVRREAELEGEWRDRNRWERFFDERIPEDHDFEEVTRLEIREREINRRLEQYIDRSDRERRRIRGQERLLEHVDDERILEAAREITANRESEISTDE
ncbi:NAD(P)/FAD-dependent oxidoreductase [Halostagnicola kamekurae]|uniref:Pyridine nucleotide-disulphide oxidoreductase n=1 Tax=Halostagnicola kamekurae TaxID=619731 RepID=A0A1I6Q7R5_9EURY|nr:NAD(P)/FAD-dependent oxidoreductase [Halostagnicola kamekurae]SFS48487.1 Pyridine nucleotide-disulphide oxidoreductase [Halostagnicola kamekurae]